MKDLSNIKPIQINLIHLFKMTTERGLGIRSMRKQTHKVSLLLLKRSGKSQRKINEVALNSFQCITEITEKTAQRRVFKGQGLYSTVIKMYLGSFSFSHHQLYIICISANSKWIKESTSEFHSHKSRKVCLPCWHQQKFRPVLNVLIRN